MVLGSAYILPTSSGKPKEHDIRVQDTAKAPILSWLARARQVRQKKAHRYPEQQGSLANPPPWLERQTERHRPLQCLYQRNLLATPQVEVIVRLFPKESVELEYALAHPGSKST